MKNVIQLMMGVTVLGFMHSASADINKLVETSSYYIEKTPGKPEWVTPKTRTVDYPADGVSLGQGWDSLRDAKVQGQCIQFTSEDAEGQVARIQTKRIFDSDSLRRELNLGYSAAASAKFAIGGGEASVKNSFVASSEVNYQYLNLLVKGEIQNGVSFVSPAKTPNGMIELTAFAAKLLKSGKSSDKAEFLKYCGDSFVASIERGAELFALYQFSSKEHKGREAKTNNIFASGSYMGFSGSASTSESLVREAVAKNELSGLKYFHTAYRGLKLPFNEESITAALASLGGVQEFSEAKPYRLKLVRYDSLPGWGQGKLESGPATREALVAAYYRLSDLRETAIDMERNPQNYNLVHAHDVIARSNLRSILDKRIAGLANVLSKCEAGKQQESMDENARKRILDKCTTQEDDVVFSDYPFRALMPIGIARMQAEVSAADQTAKLQNQVKELHTRYENTFNNAPAPVVRHKCPAAPQASNCLEITKQISELNQKLKLLQKENEFRSVAESRYSYWIKQIAQAREEDGLINGSLTPSELAMYRREIYCQYGVSPDSVKCPEVPLSQLLQEDAVVSKVKEERNINIAGEARKTPLEAWESLQDRITIFTDNTVKQKPHYFEFVEPVYSLISASSPGNPNVMTFNVKAKAIVIKYFDHNNTQINSLLTPP